jgi:olfactory receptor
MNSLISSNRRQIQDEGNQSTGVTFILLGFSEYPNLQEPRFIVFLIIYTVSVLENLGMILIIRFNLKLHTPMYFFLSHLSFVDFYCTTVSAPKLLEIMRVEDKTITVKGCITQFFFGCACVIYASRDGLCSLLYPVAMS